MNCYAKIVVFLCFAASMWIPASLGSMLPGSEPIEPEYGVEPDGTVWVILYETGPTTPNATEPAPLNASEPALNAPGPNAKVVMEILLPIKPIHKIDESFKIRSVIDW